MAFPEARRWRFSLGTPVSSPPSSVNGLANIPSNLFYRNVFRVLENCNIKAAKQEYRHKDCFIFLRKSVVNWLDKHVW